MPASPSERRHGAVPCCAESVEGRESVSVEGY